MIIAGIKLKNIIKKYLSVSLERLSNHGKTIYITSILRKEQKNTRNQMMMMSVHSVGKIETRII